MTDYDADLDVRGLSCPLPILKTKRELVRLRPGQVLRVRATDPASVVDFLVFTEKSGNAMVYREERGGEFHFWVRRREA